MYANVKKYVTNSKPFLFIDLAIILLAPLFILRKQLTKVFKNYIYLLYSETLWAAIIWFIAIIVFILFYTPKINIKLPTIPKIKNSRFKILLNKKRDWAFWLLLLMTTTTSVRAIYVFKDYITKYPKDNIRIWFLSLIALYLTALIGSIIIIIIYIIKPKLFLDTKLKSRVIYSYIIMPTIFTFLFFLCVNVIPINSSSNLFSGLVGVYCIATISDSCTSVGEALKV